VYRASIAAFTAASALCALAPDAPVLIGAVGWRGIFLVNIPAGTLAAVAVRYVPAALAPGRQPGARFDLAGLVLLAAGLTGLLLGTSQGAVAGWGSGSALVPLATGAALIACYAGWAAHRDQPALDLSLARQRGPVLAMALCALASVLTWAAVFPAAGVRPVRAGPSALAAGLAMAPQGLITGLSTALAPRLLTRLTVRVTVLAGFAILALASLQALLQPLAASQLGDASTLFNTWQRVAASFGIGLIAALYATQAREHGPVAALHEAGLVLTGIALAAVALPAVRNTALARR
jgi:hypothetical protein